MIPDPWLDYYVLLELYDLANQAGKGPEASLAEIEEAYRSQIKDWHPDNFKKDSRLWQKANDRTALLNEARLVLKNPAKKKVYDNAWRERNPWFRQQREAKSSVLPAIAVLWDPPDVFANLFYNIPPGERRRATLIIKPREGDGFWVRIEEPTSGWIRVIEPTDRRGVPPFTAVIEVDTIDLQPEQFYNDKLLFVIDAGKMARPIIHPEHIRVYVGARPPEPQPNVSHAPARSGAHWLWGLVGIVLFIGLVVGVGSLYQSRPQQLAQQVAQIVPTAARRFIPIIQPGSGCVQPPDGLVSWWPGDGNADDIIGGNNGKLVGGATFATGKVGQAFDLNGIDGFVLINSQVYSLSGGTVELWFRKHGYGPFNTIIGSWGGSGNQWAPALSVPGEIDNHLIWSFGNAGDSKLYIIHDDIWYHIAMTYDSNFNVKVYLDGELVASATSQNPGGFFDQVHIGHYANYGKQFFPGLIDEVSIYNRPLDSTEIQAIYEAGTAGKCKLGSVARSANQSPTPLQSTAAPSATPATNAKATATFAITHAAATPQQASDCIQPPDGLVSWWPGDGNADDIIGKNDGGLIGNVEFTHGMVGLAFQFYGIREMVMATAKGLPTGAAPRTVAFWAKTAPNPTEATSTGFGYSDEFDGKGFYIFPTGGDSGGRLVFTGLGPFNVIAPYDLRDNHYHHIGVTYDSRMLTIYLDGAAVASGSLNLDTGISEGACIGARCTLRGFFTGEIDEVAIWNRALFALEIEAMFKAGSAGMCKPEKHSPSK